MNQVAKFKREDILAAHFVYFSLYHINGRTERDRARVGRKTASSFGSRFYGNKRFHTIEDLYNNSLESLTRNGRYILLGLVNKYEGHIEREDLIGILDANHEKHRRILNYCL